MFSKKYTTLKIPEPFQDEVYRLQKLGYKIISFDEGVVRLRKWKLPPLTFLIVLFFPFWIFLPGTMINWILGYRFTANVYEKDGMIITE